jgi:hypothetical protein
MRSFGYFWKNDICFFLITKKTTPSKDITSLLAGGCGGSKRVHLQVSMQCVWWVGSLCIWCVLVWVCSMWCVHVCMCINVQCAFNAAMLLLQKKRWHISQFMLVALLLVSRQFLTLFFKPFGQYLHVSHLHMRLLNNLKGKKINFWSSTPHEGKQFNLELTENSINSSVTINTLWIFFFLSFNLLFYLFIFLLFICAYNARVISPPFPPPTPLPPCYQAETILPLSLILLKRAYKQ